MNGPYRNRNIGMLGGGLGAEIEKNRVVPAPASATGGPNDRRMVTRLFGTNGAIDTTNNAIDTGWINTEAFDSIVAVAYNPGGVNSGQYTCSVWDGPEQDDSPPDPATFGLFVLAATITPGTANFNGSAGADCPNAANISPLKWTRWRIGTAATTMRFAVFGIRRHYYHGIPQNPYERR